MMVFLANIGNSMASALKYVYSRMGCRWCRVRRKKAEMVEQGFLIPDMAKRETRLVDKSNNPGSRKLLRLLLLCTHIHTLRCNFKDAEICRCLYIFF